MVRYIFWALLGNLLLWSLSLYFTRQLPDPSEISRYLKTNPKQASASADSFKFSYEGESYLVDPLAEYELYGLVVSHNNIGSITDAYHTSKSVDQKDICVVWGTNVMSDVYQRAKFSSGAWTCYVNFDTNKDADDFEFSQVANNHLLSADKDIQKKIRNLHIGDQVYLRGYLVNYANAKTPEQPRKSSLVRTDTGDGACEVFYVEKLNILRKGNALWNHLKFLTYYLNFILFGIFLILFFFIEQKRFQNRKQPKDRPVRFSKY